VPRGSSDLIRASLATASLLLAAGHIAPANAQTATYEASFEGEWTTAVTPGGIPGNAHFTTLIGAVHNSQVTFWSSDGTASSGIKGMAELGSTGALSSEISAAGANVRARLLKGVAFGPTPSATFEFTVTTDHPLVTLTSMVAPSPDWFIGISGLSLRGSDGWLESTTVDLYPYDAGTEDGSEFSLNNPATSPQGTITSLRGVGKFTSEPIATLTFTLKTESDPQPQTPVVSISSGGGITEGGDAAFTITADPAPSSSLAVSVTVSQSGDFGATTGQRTVTIGSGSSSASFAVGTTDDQTDEANGSVTATLTADSGYTVSATQAVATVSVADNDDPPPPPPPSPEVTVSAGPAVTEGADARFTISRSGDTAAALTVRLAVSEDHGGGRDFVAPGNEGNRQIVIPAGDAEATHSVPTAADSTDEPNGAVTLTLRASPDYDIGNAASATVTVNDNDDPPPPPPAEALSSEGGLSGFKTAGAGSGAEFAGGATINGGVSYLPEVPSSEPVDLIVTFRPDTADVGREAEIYVVVNLPGTGAFQQRPDGSWGPLDLADLTTLEPIGSKVLAERETINIFDGLVGDEFNLAGITLDAHVAYAVDGNLAAITYNDTATPARLRFAPAAGESCPVNTAAGPEEAMFQGKPVCVLSGRIESHTHLTANFSYLLDGQVIVGGNEAGADAEKVKLTIDAGTTLFASAANDGSARLVIDRGGQLHANGSRERPVVFTHESEGGADGLAAGQWGGLVLNGAAPSSGGMAEGADGGAEYGGDRPGDSSGVLTFVQVKHAGRSMAGAEDASDLDLALAFRGAGWGTLVDYLQVHNSAGGGVEFLGGATNAKHMLLTANQGAALGWTGGWRGKLQFVAISGGGMDGHCVDGRDNSGGDDAAPRAFALASNLSCAAPLEGGGNGILLRGGTAARIDNTVIGSFGTGYCVNIDDAATFASAGGGIADLNGSLTLRHSRLAADCGLNESDADPFPVTEWFDAQAGSSAGEVDLGGESGLVNGPGLNGISPLIPDDSFFERVDHIGAIKDAASDWTSGWTHFD